MWDSRPLAKLRESAVTPDAYNVTIARRGVARLVQPRRATHGTEETLLPFTKRPARSQETSELITTDEIEVVRGTGGGAPKFQSRLPATPMSPPRPGSVRPGPMAMATPTAQSRGARPSDRPRVFQRSVSDEDKTLMMPSKRLSSAPPPPLPRTATPASARPVPGPNLRGLVRQRMDEERTMLRPASSAPPPPSTTNMRAAPAMLPTPYMPFKPPAIPGTTMAPVTMTPRGKQEDSDPRIDPPAAVITATTKLPSLRKPNVSWAAALMAAGVFVGLVTAVLARGDGDALIDATASFVDPSHAGAHVSAGAQIADTAKTPTLQLPSEAKDGTSADARRGQHLADRANAQAAAACLSPEAAPAVALNTAAPPKAEPTPAAPVAAYNAPEPTYAQPTPPKPAPIAYAAPQAAAPKAHAQSAPLYTPPQRVASAPKSAPKPAYVAPSAPSGGGGGGGGNDMANAQAADALAKAQLEASLR